MLKCLSYNIPVHMSSLVDCPGAINLFLIIVLKLTFGCCLGEYTSLRQNE